MSSTKLNVKISLLIYLHILFVNSLLAQIYNGNVVLTTQGEVDDFGANSYSVINGNLTIQGDNITDLTSLNALNQINDDLTIRSNSSLLSLSGLDNVSSIGRNLNIDFNDNISSLSVFSNITQINGNLTLNSNQSITSLIGFENLNSISGAFNIFSNNNLVSLSSLSNLTWVNWISIQSNDKLPNLNGLENVSTPGIIIDLLSNNSLISLSGLDGIITSSRLQIQGQNNLLSVDGLNNIVSIETFSLLNNPSLLNINALSSLTTTSSFLISQNTKLINLNGLENLSSVTSDFSIIENNSLLDISALSNLQIAGSIIIRSNNNLSSIDGFSNLTTCRGLTIYSNDNLLSLTGFSSLRTINGGNNLEIGFNDLLPNLNGLENLESITGGLFIYNNASLDNIATLANLISINLGIQIENNNSLTNLSGLEGIITLPGSLIIRQNDILNHLDALINLNSISDNLWITNNNSLSDCDGLCNVIGNIGGSILFSDNPSPCDSEITICGINCDLSVTALGNDPNCLGGTDGSITLTPQNGTGPYTYDWDNGVSSNSGSSLSISNLNAGTYGITLTDTSNGCSATTTVQVNDGIELQVNCSEDNPVSIAGGNDGIGHINISNGNAPFLINWSGPSSGSNPSASLGNNTINNLSAGAYMVTVTDTDNCSITCQFIMTETSCDLMLSGSGTAPTCAGRADGTITLIPINGTGPYSFTWDNDSIAGSGFGLMIEGLGEGTYNITLTDNNTCAATTSTQLTTYSFGIECVDNSPASSNSTADGSITITKIGGHSPVRIIWEGASIDSTDISSFDTYTISNLLPGDYIISVIDDNSCRTSCNATVSIEVPHQTEMVFIPGGTFEMGSENEIEPDERPIHTVTVQDFWMGKYEVTQGVFQSIMSSNPSEFKNCGEDCPVESIGFLDALTFCNRISIKDGFTPCYYWDAQHTMLIDTITGLDTTLIFEVFWRYNADGYRLPTEAEHEYVSKGGHMSQGFAYPGSNDPDSVAWSRENSNEMTHPVGLKKANELGLYDLAGNVWEYTFDHYEANYYENSPACNPIGPEIGRLRTARGGSWIVTAEFCRPSNRFDGDPFLVFSNYGMRLARGAINPNECNNCNANQDSLQLVLFHEAMNGEAWQNGWNLDQPMSTWYGVTLTEMGCVEKLSLNNNLLIGNLIDLQLPNLILLELDSNAISSALIDFTGVPNLRELSVLSNNLTGAIPNFTYLPNLKILDLSSNELNGTIPNFSNIPKLIQLNLRGNQLTGEVPNFNALPQLNGLFLSNNPLRSQITNFNHFDSLTQLHIGRAQLTETIPDFNNLPFLIELVLDFNQLEGNIPSSIGNLRFLRKLVLANNRLSGPVPETIANLDLTHFYLFNNQLEGCLPIALERFCDLSYQPSAGRPGQNLTGNPQLAWEGDFEQWCASPLNEIGAPCNDGDLNTFYDAIDENCECVGIRVENNCRLRDSLTLVQVFNELNGQQWSYTDTVYYQFSSEKPIPNHGNSWDFDRPIDEWHGVVLNEEGCVKELVMKNQNLVGYLPVMLTQLAGLEELYIRENSQLTGLIPDSIHLLANLTIIDFSKNDLTGPIPNDIGSLSNLRWLQMGSNRLSEIMPPTIGNLLMLTTLDLSENKDLTGPIPNTLGNLGNLQYLYLYDNKLQGPLPDSLFHASNLLEIRLGKNNIDGSLPIFWQNLNQVRIIELNDNCLMGTVPIEWTNLKELDFLNLSNNKLEGSFPDFTGNNFSVLRIDNNDFAYFGDYSWVSNWRTQDWGGCQVQNNRLTFEDILPNVGIGLIGNWAFIPQDSVYQDTLLTKRVGDTLIIDLGFDEEIETNQYIWFKNGLIIDTIVGSNQFFRPNVLEADAGDYWCTITNPSVPNLELVSRTISVQTEGLPCPDLQQPIVDQDTVYYCSGDSFQSLQATVIYENATIYWFENQNDTIPIWEGLTYQPVNAGTVFLATALTDNQNCQSQERSRITVVTTSLDYSPPKSICTSDVSYQLIFSTNPEYEVEIEGVDFNRVNHSVIIENIPIVQPLTIVVTDPSSKCQVILTPPLPRCACETPLDAPVVLMDQIEICSQEALPELKVEAIDTLSYNWYDEMGNLLLRNSSVFTPLTPGKYYVEAFLPNSLCKSDQSLVIVDTRNGPDLQLFQKPCNDNLNTYKVIFSAIGADFLTSNYGSIIQGTASGYYFIQDIPADIQLKVYAENESGCQDSLIISSDCCKIAPPVINNPTQIKCLEDRTLVTFNATVSDPNTITVDWYNALVEGQLLKTGSLSFSTSEVGVYYAQARKINDPSCLSFERAEIFLGFDIDSQPIITEYRKFCTSQGNRYSVEFVVQNADQIASNPPLRKLPENRYLVENIPINQTIRISAINTESGCRANLNILSPDCGCQDLPLPRPERSDIEYCEGEDYPPFKALLPDSLTGNWYTEAVGGIPLDTNTVEFRPPYPGDFYFEAKKRGGPCDNAGRILFRLIEKNASVKTIIQDTCAIELAGSQLLLAGTNSLGCDSITKLIYRFTDPPITIAFAEKDGDICDPHQPILLTGNQGQLPDEIIGDWSCLDTTIQFSEINSFSIEIDPGQIEDSLVFVWKLSSENCMNYDADSVTIYNLLRFAPQNDTFNVISPNQLIDIEFINNDSMIPPDFEFKESIIPPKYGDIYFDETLQNGKRKIVFDYIPGEEGGTEIIPYEICIPGCPNLCKQATIFIHVNCFANMDIDFPDGFIPQRGDTFNPYQEIYNQNCLNLTGQGTLTIYNQWSHLIHDSDQPALGWDGKNGSFFHPTGTYYWILKIINSDGEESIKKGSILLLNP